MPDAPSIGGYAIARPLAPGRTFLADAPGGRRIVLKILDPDCMLRRKLHPYIRDRLECVRGLAHSGVANLYGVERDGDSVYAVWEYVEGLPFDEHVTQHKIVGRDLRMLARDVAITVDSLHSLGIIHGVLSARNVIVCPNGKIRLTHVSPLLHHEPHVDSAAIVKMLRGVATSAGGMDECMAQVLDEAEKSCPSLRELSLKLAGEGASANTISTAAGHKTVDSTSRNIRGRAVLGAVLAAVAGLVLAYALWKWAAHLPPPPAEQSSAFIHQRPTL